MNKISPSVMCIDPLDMRAQVEALDAAGVDLFHIDVMDGHYVPNHALGPGLVKALRRATKTPIDVHLMVTNPLECIDMYADAGADILVMHVETLTHPIRALKRVRALGKKAGLAVSPATSVGNFPYLMNYLDMVCVLTVDPGFAGQKMIPETLQKIEQLRRLFDEHGRDVDIMVDGEVQNEKAAAMVAAGANVLVLGTSGLFGRPAAQYTEIVNKYKQIGR